MPEDRLTIELEIAAPAEAVWAAWTDPQTALRWFGSDPNGHGLEAAMDVRPEGRFELTFQNSDGTEFTCMGIYDTVVPPRDLHFSWVWKSEPETTSHVSITLSPRGAGTRMHFTHEGFGNASAHDYAIGWASTFEKLKRLLE